IIADLQQGKEVMNRPKLRVRKDGSLVLVGGTNSPLRDESGKVIGVAMMARDVTEEQRMREREQLLAGIIRSSHDTIVTRTLDGTITSWNPAAERLTGFTAEEMIGQSIFENHVPQDSSTVNRINEEILNGKVVHNEDAVRRRKDGSMFEASVTYFPLLDEVGDVKGVASVTREIGEEKRLRKQRALLEAIAQSSAKAISARDADGVIQFWNPAAERLYGYTAEEVLGAPKQFGLPGDPTIDWARVVQALQQGEDLPEQIGTRQRKDGSFFRVSEVYSPIRDEAGDIVGIAAISHDVTEEERARQESAFLASIVRNSHEAIITRTLDGVVKSWNPGAERLYGWAAEEVIGESISLLLAPDTPMEL
ncbi:MAG TPA: PAS domain S-box protein, partial [Planctomycetaceae bacterium]|nr:PAS domain S-box protein [Planctomycetaceae bacterium]